KTVCCTEYQNVTETCYKECKREVCEPVCTTKTVSKKVPETCCEQYWVPGKLKLQRVPTYSCCFDPCTCQTVQKQTGTKWALVRSPGECKTRQVTHYHTVCEQQQCTENVKKCVTEKVPYTVCKKVPVTVQKQIPVTVCKVVKEQVCVKVPYTVCRNVLETV